MPDDARIVFTPSGRRGRFPLGRPVLQAARSLGVDIDSVCGGRGLCGRCQITVSEGDFAKHGLTSCADHLSPQGAMERRYVERRGLEEGRRLSCQALVQGDLVVDVPPDSQVHKQVIRKRPEMRAIEMDPPLRLNYVEVEQPDMHNPAGQLRRLERALAKEWGLKGLSADLHVLHGLDKALAEGDYAVTVAVREDEQLVRVQPGFHDKVFGLAVDVGSTTIAAHLCDLSSGEVVAAGGAMNPQIRFGEDLMSRVSYVQMNPGGDAQMTRVVRRAINKLAAETAAEAGIEVDDILEVTVVGNPIMHHLLLGLDPTPLGGAPFALATDEALTLKASEIGLTLNPGARAYVLPCVAGHVGADTAGVLLSEEPHKRGELTLLVDVGTNAELVLGNKGRLLAASSPTGPAFEGAQISCGQRAAPGAIERLRIDQQSLEPRFKIIGSDLWSDDPEFLASPTGVCGSGIVEAVAEMYLAGIVTQDGVIDGAMAARSPRIVEEGRTFSYVLHEGEPRLAITQQDVRQIQLAKAALHAGARLLMDRMGVDRVERIALAGAFGSYIDVTHAMALGMIPDCDLKKVSSAGNAAGTGARIALLNRKARAEIEAVVRQVEKVETAVEPRFQEHFVAAMAIPHKTAPYPNLARTVRLPAPKKATVADALPARRRRRA
ncbi:MAG: ASKHA domain-containing protein [Alphaproteobacteria bacterium]